MNAKIVSLFHFSLKQDRAVITLKEAIEETGYSEKQIKRDVKQWELNEWVKYRPGKGRGNESTIEFRPQFSHELTEWAKRAFLEGSMVEVTKWLDWGWPQELREMIQSQVWGRFGFDQTEEDRFIFPRTRQLASLDPLDIHIAMEASLSRNVFDRLFEWDGTKVQPSLAHYIEETSFGMRCYIRKGIYFHNGMPLTAKDVAYSLNRLLKRGKQTWLFGPINHVETPAPYIVDIYTKSHRAYIQRLLAQTPASITYKGAEGTVGTGPFKLEIVSKELFRLRAYDRGLRPRPSIDVVEFVTFSEQDYLKWSMRDDHRIKQWFAEAGARYVVFNMKHSWLKEEKSTRLAIERAIDKQSFVMHGGERHQVAHGFFPDSSRRINLVEEGVVTLRPIRLIHLPFETAREDAWIIAGQLRAAGFIVETDVYSLESLLLKETLERADLILCGEMMSEDVDLAFLAFLTSELSLVGKLLNGDQKLQSLMERYQKTDMKEWRKIHRETERYLVEEALVVPLYHVARERRFPSYLGNVPIDVFGHPRYEQLWIRPNI